MPSDAVTIVATAVGWLIGAGSTLLYTPMIFRVVRKWSADGLAASTWWLKFSSYTALLVYNVARGFPLNTYLETAVIFCEASAMLMLVLFIQRQSLSSLNVAATTAFVAAALVLSLSPGLRNLSLPFLAVYASAVATLAIVPQILLNCRRRSSGEFSPVTALLATVGNLLRVGTTAVITGDVLLLLGALAGACINGVLLAQIYAFRRRAPVAGSCAATEVVPWPVACRRFWLADVVSPPGDYDSGDAASPQSPLPAAVTAVATGAAKHAAEQPGTTMELEKLLHDTLLAPAPAQTPARVV